MEETMEETKELQSICATIPLPVLYPAVKKKARVVKAHEQGNTFAFDNIFTLHNRHEADVVKVRDSGTITAFDNIFDYHNREVGRPPPFEKPQNYHIPEAERYDLPENLTIEEYWVVYRRYWRDLFRLVKVEDMKMLERLKGIEQDIMEKVSIGYKFNPPDEKVDVKRGVEYYCTQKQIDQLQDRLVAPQNDGEKYIDIYAAVAALKKRRMSKASCDRLWKFSPELFRVVVYPTLVFKIFNDLDSVFFNGMLKGNVYLRLVEDTGKAYGWANPRGVVGKRVTITINLTHIYTRGSYPARYLNLIETLLHEMVHAFLFVMCGQVEGRKGNKEPVGEQVKEALGYIPGRNRDGRHGTGFQMVLAEVQERLDRFMSGLMWRCIDMRQGGYY